MLLQYLTINIIYLYLDGGRIIVNGSICQCIKGNFKCKKLNVNNNFKADNRDLTENSFLDKKGLENHLIHKTNKSFMRKPEEEESNKISREKSNKMNVGNLEDIKESTNKVYDVTRLLNTDDDYDIGFINEEKEKIRNVLFLLYKISLI